MSRRVRLPGADELFRSTGPEHSTTSGKGAERAESPASTDDGAAGREASGDPGIQQETAALQQSSEDARATDATAGTDPRSAGSRHRDRSTGQPSGRQRHDEKITVYCSASELLELERARLQLRGDHGLSVDRGRIVREAIAVLLADLEVKGERSVLVRRLARH